MIPYDKNSIRRSVTWFKNLLKMFRRTGKASVKTLRGRLILMTYDPVTKDKLPYYDTQPLIFVVEVRSNYLLGINVHYLPPRERKVLVDGLMGFKEDASDEQILMRMRYADIQSVVVSSQAKMLIKKYYTRRIKNMMIVAPEEWDNVIQLPLYRFEKKSVNEVWAATKRKMK